MQIRHFGSTVLLTCGGGCSRCRSSARRLAIAIGTIKNWPPRRCCGGCSRRARERTAIFAANREPHHARARRRIVDCVSTEIRPKHCAIEAQLFL